MQSIAYYTIPAKKCVEPSCAWGVNGDARLPHLIKHAVGVLCPFSNCLFSDCLFNNRLFSNCLFVEAHAVRNCKGVCRIAAFTRFPCIYKFSLTSLKCTKICWTLGCQVWQILYTVFLYLKRSGHWNCLYIEHFNICQTYQHFYDCI